MSNISLNKQQLQAVKHKSGPLLIVAGAGTGKTAVITERIKLLIQKQKLSPQQILALTFTDKAAKEMLDRLDMVMPLGYEEPWLSTFHAFCDRILKAEGLEIGLDPNFKIISRPNQWILIKKHLFDFKLSYYRPLGNPTKFISALLTFFSRAQDEDVSPTDLIKYAKKLKSKSKSKEEKEDLSAVASAKEGADKLLEVSRAFQTYQALKLKQSVFDFGDLITKTLELFRSRPSILKKYQQQFEYILIDEFQDTNYAQYQLIKLLAPEKKNPNLTVVADDDQAIYRWRGAAIANILFFKDDYPNAREIILTQNYRSIKPILTFAYKVIQNNNPDRLETKLGINKKLTPTRAKKTAQKPQIVSLASSEAETDWITKQILELTARENYTYKDFAILTRANSQLKPFVTSFKHHGLPYQLVGNRGLFDQLAVRELVNFFQVIVNPEDSIPLYQFLHSNIFDISAPRILALIQTARNKRVPLWTVLKERAEKKYQQVVILITNYQKQILKSTPTKIVFKFLQDTNFIKQFVKQESIENELAIKNVNLFLKLISRFETDTSQTGQTSTVIDLVDYLDLLIEAGNNPAQAEIEDIDTIMLITIHSAKGLEFPVVFMPSLVAGRFPAINRRDPIEFPEALIKESLPEGNQNIQDERRLFYVGMTRARDYLFLTWAKDYGGVRERRPSGFLSETKLPTHEVEDDPQLTLLDSIDSSKPKPVKVKSGKINLSFVSYSQIDTFKTCPLKYKYRYILRVPSKPHHALSFGQSVHDTLRHFHQFEQQGKQVSLKDLLFLYQQYFRDQGYDSQAHKQERFKAGKKALRQYYKVYKHKLGKPVELEKSFRLTVGGIPLIGKIDRIDKMGDKYEIIDYKTGQSQDKKKVDKDEQLSIYALGARHALNINPKSLSLYFLEGNKKVSTTRSDKQLKDTFKRLQKRVRQMQTSSFPAKPGSPFPCGYCEYNKICPYAAKKR